MTFTGSIKGRANALSVFCSHIFKAGQTNSLPHIFFKQDRPTLFLTHSSSRTEQHSTRGERIQPWAIVPFGD